jgi:hypothetical protein
MLNDSKLKNLSSIAELCQWLIEIEKSERYHLIDRLVRLVLTLSVSTATTERAFSAMKVIKTRLRNKMDDEFLANSLVVYIEGKISESFNSDLILDDFVSLRHFVFLFNFVLLPTWQLFNILIMTYLWSLIYFLWFTYCVVILILNCVHHNFIYNINEVLYNENKNLFYHYILLFEFRPY